MKLALYTIKEILEDVTMDEIYEISSGDRSMHDVEFSFEESTYESEEGQ